MPDGLTPTPDAWQEIQNPSKAPPTGYTGANGSTRAQIAGRLEWARRLGRVTPTLRNLGQFTIIGSGFLFGWEIGSGIYRKIEGGGGFTPRTAIDKTKWQHIQSDGQYRATPGASLTASGAHADLHGYWSLWWHATGDAPTFYTDTFSDCAEAGVSTSSCTPDVGQNGAMTQVLLEKEAQWPEAERVFSGTTTVSSVTVNRYRLRVSEEDYEAHMHVEDIDSTEYSTINSGDRFTNHYTQPTFVEGDKQIAGATIWNDGDTIGQDTTTWIVHQYDPDYEPDPDDGLMPLFEPGPNETYGDYLVRLQAAGYLGTVTVTELAPDALDEAVGPLAISRIRVTSETGVTTYQRPWISPTPRIGPEHAIRFIVNPASAPTQATGSTTVTGAPTTIPTAPAIDFSPLTDVDFGCKFPYGFLCYAVEVTETFDVSDDAPRFVFDIPTVNVGVTEFGGGEDGWVVDLEVMDDWAEIWRDIWSVVIVIGAVYLVATRLLGFKAGGDPGEAMDDV